MLLPAFATVTVSVALASKVISDRRHNSTLEREEQAKKERAKLEGRKKGQAEQSEEARKSAEDRHQQEIKGALLLWLIFAVPIFAVVFFLEFYKGYNRKALATVAASVLVTGIASLTWVANLPQETETSTGETDDAQPELIAPKENLTGTWIKHGVQDSDASESMIETMDLVQLPRLVRTAVKLMRGIQIVQTTETFEFSIFSLIGWFRVTETYELDGSVSMQKRRDLRRGQHQGRAIVNSAGHLCLHLTWADPVGGQGIDEFWLHDINTLHVKSVCRVNNHNAGYLTVYRRKQ